jgi:glycerol-3-phosphate acyltransferase PlsY
VHIGEVTLVAAAYLLGTFPTALLVGRSTGHDVTREGSGNPGATNVYRLAGRRAGAIVFAGDAAKGVLAAAVGRLAGGTPLALAMGAAAVVGHCLPATRRFKGGKGVATAAGMAVVVEPWLGLAAVPLWAATAKLTKRASIASLAIAVVVPLAALAIKGPHAEAAVLGAVSVFVIARHRGNIGRLVRGDESPVTRAG